VLRVGHDSVKDRCQEVRRLPIEGHRHFSPRDDSALLSRSGHPRERQVRSLRDRHGRRRIRQVEHWARSEDSKPGSAFIRHDTANCGPSGPRVMTTMNAIASHALLCTCMHRCARTHRCAARENIKSNDHSKLTVWCGVPPGAQSAVTRDHRTTHLVLLGFATVLQVPSSVDIYVTSRRTLHACLALVTFDAESRLVLWALLTVDGARRGPPKQKKNGVIAWACLARVRFPTCPSTGNARVGLWISRVGSCSWGWIVY